MKSQNQLGLTKLREFKSHTLYKYGLSFTIVVIATVIQNLIYPYIEPAPFLLFYPAVILACLYGDGISAILLSSLAAQYFIVYPLNSFAMDFPNDYVRLSLFLVATLMIRKIIRQQTIDKLKAQAAVEKLEQSENDLKLERQAREQFVSTLTHDLQTPLTAVKLNIDLMKRKKDDPENILKFIMNAGANVTRIESMIQNLLDANRIKAGQKLSLDCEEISMNSLVDKTVKDLTLIHGDRFTIKTQDDLVGFWSMEGVRRIIENLCHNAVKYGDKNSITISTDVITNGVVISVNNKGSVIPDGDKEFLFDHYKRSESAEQSSQKGWGIGLTLVKGIAEAHEGSVTFKSNEEDGTTFSVILPKDSRRTL